MLLRKQRLLLIRPDAQHRKMSYALKTLRATPGNALLSGDKSEEGTEERYAVQYLGNIQTIYPVGEAMCGAVEEIYENARRKKPKFSRSCTLCPKMELVVADESFELRPLTQGEPDKTKAQLFSLKRITYCGVDRKRNKTFAFNYHEQSEGNQKSSYRTHAMLCTNKEAARNLAHVVAEYFRESGATTGHRRNSAALSRREVLRGFDQQSTECM